MQQLSDTAKDARTHSARGGSSAQGIRADNNAMATPAAAIGVLYFMEIKLEDLDFYRSTAALAAAPVFLKLLNQIATKHTSMVRRPVCMGNGMRYLGGRLSFLGCIPLCPRC